MTVADLIAERVELERAICEAALQHGLIEGAISPIPTVELVRLVKQLAGTEHVGPAIYADPLCTIPLNAKAEAEVARKKRGMP